MNLVRVLVAASVVFVVGCGSSSEDIKEDYTLPEELKHCSMYKLKGGAFSRAVRVVHCPNSTTTTTSGKGQSVTVVSE